MSGKFKWVVLALSLSLMLNVFAAGHFFGDKRRGRAPTEGEWSGRLLPSDIRGKIPQDARKAFRQAMLGERQDVRAARQTLRAARKRVIEALREETLDRDALEAALSDVRTATGQLQGSFERSLAAALATMTPDQRLEVARRMTKRSGDFKDRLRRRQEGRPPPPEGAPPPPGEF